MGRGGILNRVQRGALDPSSWRASEPLVVHGLPVLDRLVLGALAVDVLVSRSARSHLRGRMATAGAFRPVEWPLLGLHFGSEDLPAPSLRHVGRTPGPADAPADRSQPLPRLPVRPRSTS